MSDLITDAMVEAAAKTRWDYARGDLTEWEMRYPAFRESDTEAMRAALEAIAPLIAAKAWDEGYAMSERELDHAYGGHPISQDGPCDMCHECGTGNPYRADRIERGES